MATVTRPPAADRHRRTEVLVVGAGIVGLATARAILVRRPGTTVTVVDKELGPGRHQSGHNSGVLHAGVYYAPGSAKARLCGAGRQAMVAYCAAAGIDLQQCGKLIVASAPDEVVRLASLEQRGRANGLAIERLGPGGITEREPHVVGAAALWVAATGVVDFAAVTARLAAAVLAAGATVVYDTKVERVAEDVTGVTVAAAGRTWRADRVVACAGLHADHLVRHTGQPLGVRVTPFRGEYHELTADRSHLVRGLVYPVPDPRLPFLGVHLTRGIDGRVHVGPNAVLALGREAYRWGRPDRHELAELLRDPALWRLSRRWWRTGAAELARSLSPQLAARAARRLVPELRAGDLTRATAGIRAQAVADDGSLLDDFVFHETRRCLHVLNAPSPAATASLAIGEHLADRLFPTR
jgi:L-2-hydroxyglutarate oxidase